MLLAALKADCPVPLTDPCIVPAQPAKAAIKPVPTMSFLSCIYPSTNAIVATERLTGADGRNSDRASMNRSLRLERFHVECPMAVAARAGVGYR